MMLVAVLAFSAGAVLNPEVPTGASTHVAADTELPGLFTAGAHDGGRNALQTAEYPGDIPVFVERHTPAGALEPDLDFSADGRAHYFSWTSPGIDSGSTTANHVFRTADDGVTWDESTPTWLQIDTGIDPLMYRDPWSDRLFLVAHNNYGTVAWTDDGGDTWISRPPILATTPGVTDFPTLFAAEKPELTPGVSLDSDLIYPSTLLFCYFTAVVQECQRSVDGGVVWTYTGMPFETRGLGCLYGTARGDGGGPDGSFYYPVSAYGGEDCSGSSVENRREVWISVSHDSGTSWEMRPVDLSDRNGGNVRVDVDDDGNVYVLFRGTDGQLYLSISTDQGETFRPAFSVSPPGITANKVAALVVGDPGKIMIHSAATSVPGGFSATTDDLAEATWHPLVTTSLNVLDAEPTFYSTFVTTDDDPMVRGACEGRCTRDVAACADACDLLEATTGDRCWEGLCNLFLESQGLYDYANAKIDPTTGYAWAIYVDLCTDACATPVGTTESATGFFGAVGVQVSGTPLRSI